MSAFYSLCYADRVELLTDGAIYLDDGTLTDIKEKVHRSPYVPMAITGRGSSAMDAFAKAIIVLSARGSFDHTMARTVEMLERRKPLGAPEPCEVFIAGISETSGPAMYYFSTMDSYGLPEFETWTLYDVTGEFGGGPMPTPDEIAGMDPSNGLAGCGVALFEAMRRQRGPNPNKPELPEIYGVGGHIDHTVIDASGARTQRLLVWPDEVGQKIRPVATLI